MVRLCKKINKDEKVTIKNEPDKAYLAGLFDGEGSFMIRVDEKKSPPKFSPLVTISMSDEPVIEKVANLIGYEYTSVKRTREGKKYKPMYRITITIEDDVKDLLNQLHPYLVGKKRQAEIVLELISLKANLGYERTREIALRKFELWKEIPELNPRGGPPTDEQCNRLQNKINESFQ